MRVHSPCGLHLPLICRFLRARHHLDHHILPTRPGPPPLALPNYIFSLPFRPLLRITTPSTRPLQAFWMLIAGATFTMHLLALVRLFALIATYAPPVHHEMYGLPPLPSSAHAPPPLDFRAIVASLVGVKDGTELGRSILVFDYLLSVLALAGLQAKRFSTVTAAFGWLVECAVLGPAASFAAWRAWAAGRVVVGRDW